MILRLLKQYYPIRNLFFILFETLLICASILLVGRFLIGEGVSFKWLFFQAIFVTSVFQISLYYHNLYDYGESARFSDFLFSLLQAIGIASIILALIYFIFPAMIIKDRVFTFSLCIILFIICLWHFAYKYIIDSGLFNQNILLLGSGELAEKIIEEIHSRRDCGYNLVCIAMESPDHHIRVHHGNTMFFFNKKHEGLSKLARDLHTHKMVVALEEKRGGFPTKELLDCRIEGIDVLEGTSFYEMLSGKLLVTHINPGWLIYSEGFKKSYSRLLMKRGIDLVLSFTLLVALAPLILLTIAWIKIDSPGPILYSQERVGQRRKLFKIHKFRSMVQDAEKLSGPKWAEEEDPRITKVGRIMRKTRIDELPQLWNILKGEMSFVGPRPEREFFVKNLELMIPYYGERFIVKPGLSGWAQVNYPYGASIEDAIEKLNYELFYIKNMSIFFDLVIVFRTVKTVLFREGGR